MMMRSHLLDVGGCRAGARVERGDGQPEPHSGVDRADDVRIQRGLSSSGDVGEGWYGAQTVRRSSARFSSPAFLALS